MPKLVELSLILAVVFVWKGLLEIGLTILGPQRLRDLWKRQRTQEDETLRDLSQWQVILIEGLLKIGFPMALGFTALDTARPVFQSSYRLRWDEVVFDFVAFGILGAWSGRRRWRDLSR